MHTYTAKQGTVFNYDPDLSGHVRIQLAEFRGDKMEVPGADLVEFVAEHVRQERISRLEDASAGKILGLE